MNILGGRGGLGGQTFLRPQSPQLRDLGFCNPWCISSIFADCAQIWRPTSGRIDMTLY